MRIAVVTLVCLFAVTARAESPPSALDAGWGDKGDRGIFVVDGSAVHDIGELQLNITNWGLIGSKPLLDAPYSNSPSAMWPAGSGIDHLFAAGLWVGGVKNGVPLVSTGQLETEFIPTSHPLDTIYEMRAGDPGGARYPYPNEDDDGDRRINEEVVDGKDDDGDGQIDEDYARIGDQQFRCRFGDVEPVIRELSPDHEPLGLEVIQESYQWDAPRLDDTVVLDYTLTNVGNDVIDGMRVGFYADPDIGPRDGGRISENDLVGHLSARVRSADASFVNVDLAYMYDCEIGGPASGGYIGFMFVNRSIQSFQYFVGRSSYERGGDPSNDEERYEVMSGPMAQTFPDECSEGGDYRFVIASSGGRLSPGQRFRFQIAIVMGKDLDDLVDNAAEVAATAYGQWFDRDNDAETGTRGRETRLCDWYFGESGPNNPIFTFQMDCAHAFPSGERPPTISPNDLDASGCTWINGDCSLEALRGAGDARCRDEQFYTDNSLGACTGVRGREFNVTWLADRPPPRPDLRSWADDNRVHMFWSSRAEEERDLRWNLPSFEAYRIWRADDWERPLGSSLETGPGSEQWKRLAEFDVVSTYVNHQGNVEEELPLGSNTGLGFLAYTPAILQEGSPESIEFHDLERLVNRIDSDHPGLDPDVPVRYRDSRGVVTDLGEEYPELAMWDCCTAQLDTLLWEKLGRRFYEYVDETPLNGLLYFYSVTATMNTRDESGDIVGYGAQGRPLGNFEFVVPQSPAQTREQRAVEGQNVYVVPNPVTRGALSEFSALHPNQDDPTGVRLEFRNLPRARNTVTIYTLAGDVVAVLQHDGRQGHGSLPWNLVSRNGQEIVSGIYLYTVESDVPDFARVVGRFVVVR